MKILHVVPSYLPAVRYGGPIHSVHGLARGLVELGHSVDVYTTSVDGDRDSDVPHGEAVDLDGVKVYYFRSSFLRRLYWSPGMRSALRSAVSRYDLVHLHSVFLWPTSRAARCCAAAGVPYVLSPRGMLVKELVRRKSAWAKRLWIRLVETRTLNNASLVHVTSKIEQTELRQFGFRPHRVSMIPNGVELPDPDPGELSPDVARAIRPGGYILYLGRLNWKKGLDRLIRSMVQVDGSRLVIAGNDEEGYMQTLTGLTREAKVEDSVTFLPRYIDGADKEALFANAAVFVLPSYSENFGNTVAEALARGCPAVVTEDVGAKELVMQSSAGLVVDGADLGKALTRLLDAPATLEDYSRRGKRWVTEHLSWRSIAARMAEEYRELLAGGARV